MRFRPDSALGKKRNTVRTQRVTLSGIIPAEGLGAFSLRPTQRPPQNAYVSLDWLEQRLDEPGRVNAIFTESDSPVVHPQLADYGLRVDRTALGYWNITCDRMMLDPAMEQEIAQGPSCDVENAARRSTGDDLPGQHVGLQRPRGALFDDYGHRLRRPAAAWPVPLGQREAAAAARPERDRIELAGPPINCTPGVGDTVRLAYFEPESLDGQVREKTVALRLAASSNSPARPTTARWCPRSRA